MQLQLVLSQLWVSVTKGTITFSETARQVTCAKQLTIQNIQALTEVH